MMIKSQTLVLSILLIGALPFAVVAQQPAPQRPPSRRTTAQPPPSQPATPVSTEPETPPGTRRIEEEQQRPARAAAERERAEEPQQERGFGGGQTNTAFHFDMHESAASVTHHQISVNGRSLRYTATAGRMPVMNGEGVTEALMFYVAYTLDGVDSMTFNNYVRTELAYKTDMPYYTFGQESGMFLWKSSGTTNAPGGPQGFQEEITPLRAAVVGDPFLKVLVMEGYYDLATPYLQAEYTIHELDLPASYRNNIRYERYWSGHMVYLEQKSHAKLHGDWDTFVAQTKGE